MILFANATLSLDLRYLTGLLIMPGLTAVTTLVDGMALGFYRSCIGISACPYSMRPSADFTSVPEFATLKGAPPAIKLEA